jgi:cytochrome c-type biogenesis protein CcmH/NrfG
MSEAEATYQKATQVIPSNPRTFLTLGDFYVSTQRLDAAVAAYKQAATLDPQAVAPKERLGQLAIGQKRLDEVAKYADELSKTLNGRFVGRSFHGYLALARG